jgi:hypothetical protein
MPTCFLAMGFGKKTAFYLGKKKPRTLTRHMKTSSSRMSPRPGSPGVRADEIQHSTMIDKPMYEQLLVAENEFAFPLCASTSCVTSISARTLALQIAGIFGRVLSCRKSLLLVIADEPYSFLTGGLHERDPGIMWPPGGAGEKLLRELVSPLDSSRSAGDEDAG